MELHLKYKLYTLFRMPIPRNRSPLVSKESFIPKKILQIRKFFNKSQSCNDLVYQIPQNNKNETSNKISRFNSKCSIIKITWNKKTHFLRPGGG
jgi:hypothetical protein